MEDFSHFNHDQSENIETSLCQNCRDKKKKRDRKRRKTMLNAVCDDKNKKNVHIVYISETRLNLTETI